MSCTLLTISSFYIQIVSKRKLTVIRLNGFFYYFPLLLPFTFSFNTISIPDPSQRCAVKEVNAEIWLKKAGQGQLA